MRRQDAAEKPQLSRPPSWKSMHTAEPDRHAATLERQIAEAQSTLAAALERRAELVQRAADGGENVEVFAEAEDQIRASESTIKLRNEALEVVRARRAEVAIKDLSDDELDRLWRELFDRQAAWAERAREFIEQSRQLAQLFDGAAKRLGDRHPLMEWVPPIRELLTPGAVLSGVERVLAAIHWRRGLGLPPEQGE